MSPQTSLCLSMLPIALYPAAFAPTRLTQLADLLPINFNSCQIQPLHRALCCPRWQPILRVFVEERIRWHDHEEGESGAPKADIESRVDVLCEEAD